MTGKFTQNNGVYNSREDLGLAVEHMVCLGRSWTNIANATGVSVRTAKRALEELKQNRAKPQVKTVSDAGIYSGLTDKQERDIRNYIAFIVIAIVIAAVMALIGK